jgi:peroxiredoxin
MPRILTAFLALAVLALPAPALAEAKVGQPAPDFTATDIHGNAFALAEQRGKPVVLEWTNHDCPFVVKHYSTGNMQAAQKAAREGGAVWVSIVSSAPDKQGHVTAEQAAAILAEQGAAPTTQILDPAGAIGRAYGAKTTPHMFVIDAGGVVAYAGAIDDNPSADPATVAGATNYALAALEALRAGAPVDPAETRAYGCSVKY